MRRFIFLALLLLVPASAVVIKGTNPDGGDDKQPASEKWEYLVVAGPTTTNFTPTSNPRMRKEELTFAREAFVLETHMDKLGTKGWELVSVSGLPQDPVYYFKRRK